jgi:Family of unknown function (DUF6152)
MRRKIAVIAQIAGLLLTAVSASAHHSFAAEFSANKPIKLQGTIVKIEWINPHSWFYIDVTGSTGKTVTWMIEGGSPNTLLRRGFTRDSVKVGAEIVVDGFQAKDGSNRANGRGITFTDGKQLFMGSSNDGAPDPGK